MLNIGQQLSTDPNLGRIVTSPVYFTQFKASSIAKIFCLKKRSEEWDVGITSKLVCSIVNLPYTAFKTLNKTCTTQYFHYTIMQQRTVGLLYPS
jgi:hypothetical protein